MTEKNSDIRTNDTAEDDAFATSLEKHSDNNITTKDTAEDDAFATSLEKNYDNNITSKDTAEDENNLVKSNRCLRKEITVENEVIVAERPIKNMGIVEDAECGDTGIRASETVEDPDSSKQANIFDGHCVRPRVGTLRKTKIVFKINHIKEEKSNKDSPIKGLPTIPLTKQVTEKVLFGRGECVDVYLHDMLASRQHMELNVEMPSFRVSITNISQKKPIRINGTKLIEYKNKYTLNNNDHVTVGAVTFLIEIAPGESGCLEYEITFINLFDSSMSMHAVSNNAGQSFYPRQTYQSAMPQQNPSAMRQQYPSAMPQQYPPAMPQHYPSAMSQPYPYGGYSQAVPSPRQAFIPPGPDFIPTGYSPQIFPQRYPPDFNPIYIQYGARTNEYSHQNYPQRPQQSPQSYHIHNQMQGLHLNSNDQHCAVETVDNYRPSPRRLSREAVENTDQDGNLYRQRHMQSSQTMSMKHEVDSKF